VRARRVEVHVDRLVLHCFGPLDRDRLGAAVRLELARLLRATDARVSGSADIVDTGSVPLEARSSEEVVGASIADAVYRGLYR
jgi:hypothetical protein